MENDLEKQVELKNYRSNHDSSNNNNDNYGFEISKTEIDEIFGFYKKHNCVEEYESLRKLGGIQGLLKKLQTDENSGLIVNEKELLRRIKAFDDNITIEKPMTTCCEYVWEALKDLMLRILIVAAIVQIILGSIPGIAEDPSKEWVEGMSIIIAVSIVVSVGSVTNWTKEKSFRDLNKKTDDDLKLLIIRDSRTVNFHPNDILVGDIVAVNYGKSLKVDGIVLTSNGLEFDESPLTGESTKKKKVIFSDFSEEINELNLNRKKKENVSSCLLFSGTKCVKGEGKFLVLRVGKNSEKGKIQDSVMASLESDDSKSPLEEKLDTMAGDIGKFGMIAAIVTFIALIIRFGVSYHFSKVKYDEYILNSTANNQTNTDNIPLVENPSKTVGHKILRIILLCVAIIVVAIPEGLPLAVTLSLAFAIAKMQKENNLVRFMTSCETMGTANYICSDKTGTLTTNVMTVLRIFTPSGKDLEVEKNISDSLNKYPKYWNFIRQSMGLNIDIKLVKDETGELVPNQDSNAADRAFFKILQDKLKCNYVDQKKQFMSNQDNYKTIPFDSNRKCMSTLIKSCKFNIDGWRVFHKGGGDKTLLKLKYIYNKDTDNIELITNEKLKELSETLKFYAKQCLRNFIFAYKDISNEESAKFEDRDENDNLKIEKDNFVFLGIAGIKDPLKEGVDSAVKSCQKAGITVIMVTGDNIDTAIAISKECSILNESEHKIIREQLDNVEIKTERKFLELISQNLAIREENVTRKTNNQQLKEELINNRENIFKEILEKYNNRSFLAMEGRELSEKVGLICKTCEKSVNDNFIHEGIKNFDKDINQKYRYELTGGKENSQIRKCFCLPHKTAALKKFPNIPESDLDKVIRKEELGNLEEFKRITKSLKVVTRAQPADKYLLVFGLRKLGNVVAVTGDGTNDAPALSKADVGFSMGKAGTDVAKEASDIILLDDNFSSIVNAVKWGRNIFDCIRKFIQFQLTVNVTACLLVFICGCIGNESPLTAIQMLWVNLIMDSLGSLALATEPPSENLLDRNPYKRSEYPVNKKMWKHILIQSSFQLGILLILYLHAPQFVIEDEPYRIAEADLINLCFGDYPGRDPENGVYYILDGSINSWSSDSIIIKGYGIDQCGIYGTKTNLSDILNLYDINNGNTAHMTLIFNTFVIYTLFNQINARILDDSFNIFRDIHKNLWFLCIEIVEFFLHAVLIQIGSSVFKVSYKGLTGNQWGICIGFGSLTFAVNFFIKFIPDSLFSFFDKLDDSDEKSDEEGGVQINEISLNQPKLSENDQFNVIAEQNKAASKKSSNRDMKNYIRSGSKNVSKKLASHIPNMNNSKKNI